MIDVFHFRIGESACVKPKITRRERWEADAELKRLRQSLQENEPSLRLYQYVRYKNGGGSAVLPWEDQNQMIDDQLQGGLK
jgi:hypothetical protein